MFSPEAMISSQSRTNKPRRPSDEEWEEMRPLITRLWYKENVSLPVIIALFRDRFNLIVTYESFSALHF